MTFVENLEAIGSLLSGGRSKRSFEPLRVSKLKPSVSPLWLRNIKYPWNIAMLLPRRRERPVKMARNDFIKTGGLVPEPCVDEFLDLGRFFGIFLGLLILA